MESKRNETFGNVIFSTNKTQETWTLCQDTKEEATRQGARLPSPGAPSTLVGPLLLHRRTPSSYIPTYPQMIRYGAKNLIPPPQLSVSTRSHLGASSGAPPERAVITEGFYIIIAPPMKCEQFTSDLRVHSQYLDGFFSLFGSQYKVLPLSCGDLFDVIFFLRCVC